MIAENKAEFDKAGVTAWHEAGYLGQGITIAVLDVDPYIPDHMKKEGVYFDPLHVDDGKGGADGHTASVAKVIHEVAPAAHIHMFGSFSGQDYVAAHLDDYDIVNCSMTGIPRKLLNFNIPITKAAGNDGDINGWRNVYGPPMIIVGAQEEYREKPATYSDGGIGLDCMGYTNIATPTKYPFVYHTFNGTSCAAPFVCGQLALLMSKVGKLDGKAAKEFVLSHCKDLEEPGKDNKTGYGLFTLPDPSEVEGLKIVMTLGEKTAVVDGNAMELDVAPYAKDGRTMVPIRFISEAMGCKVDYDPKTKTVTITK